MADIQSSMGQAAVPLVPGERYILSEAMMFHLSLRRIEGYA